MAVLLSKGVIEGRACSPPIKRTGPSGVRYNIRRPLYEKQYHICGEPEWALLEVTNGTERERSVRLIVGLFQYRSGVRCLSHAIH